MPRSTRSRAALVALTALALAPGCGRGVPREAPADFGDFSAPPPPAEPCLALAREALSGRGEDAGAPSGDAQRTVAGCTGAGRRVVVSAWREGRVVVGTAAAARLEDAVRAAAREAAARLGASDGVRLEIDVPVSVGRLNLDEDVDDAPSVMGLDGYLVTRADGRTGVVLPGEVVQRELVHKGHVAHAALAQLLAERAAVRAGDLATMRPYRFRADAHVEDPAGAHALPLVRGMVAPDAELTPEGLLAAVRRGADYLVRSLGPNGRYAYLYHPARDRDDATYGWLRHAGSTYALLEAYGELHAPAYLEAAERALGALSAHLTPDPESQGKYTTDTQEEEQQKVGGAGLALLAFAERAAVRADDSAQHAETRRALARFLLHRQYADGHFRSNADLERETWHKLPREAIYYPGEAVLALMRLYAVDPEPSYLDAARRGADYVVRVRDAYTSEENQEHDHWISYALNELYRVTRDPAYLDHAYKIARAIEKRQSRAYGARAADLPGMFYDGAVTPSATRLEAYDADICLSRFADRPGAWLLEPAREVARATLAQQYSAKNDYWLRNPARADGGVRESLLVDDVRIDYVQHAVSAWLHLARILRDPAYGKTGVPSQDAAGTSAGL